MAPANPQTAAALACAEALIARHTSAFVDKVNIYTCEECSEHIVTRDLAVGVTPFLVACRCTPQCKGMMKSSMYRVFDQTMREGFQWYRPEPHEELAEHELNHVSRGGLLLRARP